MRLSFKTPKIHRHALLLLCASALFALGCQGAIEAPNEADDSAALTRLEGAELEAALADDRVSPAVEVETPFIRLAILWDAADEGAIEVRTSEDGVTWSEWQAPEVHFVEEVAHVGTLDVTVPARFHQFRVPEGVALPTHVAIDPVASLPEEPSEGAALPEGYDEGDGMFDASSPETSGEIGAASEALVPIRLTVHSRAEWGARAPRCISSTSPYRVTIHHTVTPTRDSMSVPARLRQIQSYHMFGRGWCDIGYNYLISRDGRVWVGRGARHLGAHAYNNNTGNVGISYLGTYSSTRLNDAQVTNGAKLIARLHRRFPAIALNRTDVKGHRQLGATGGGTECPGNAAYGQLDAIVRKARTY